MHNPDKIKNALAMVGEATVNQLMAITGLEQREIKVAMRSLKSKQLVVSSRKGNGGQVAKYALHTGLRTRIKNIDKVIRVVHTLDGEYSTMDIAVMANLTRQQIRMPLEHLASLGYISSSECQIRKTTMWKRVWGMELPEPVDPIVSGAQAHKFMKTIPKWVPPKNMGQFLSSLTDGS